MISRPGLLILVVIAGGASARANEPDDLVDHWMTIYHDTAKSVEMQFADKPDVNVKLVEPPLLKYANPVRGVQQHGAIYLWTVEGRPAVIASFWSAMERQQPDLRRLNFEWHSLSDSSLIADRNTERLWEAGEPGVEWQPLTDAPEPATSRALRLRQMRRLASSFSAEIETGESELRLMPQPLYRYPEDAAGVLDGAVFAFVMGTDPELFLLVEARRAEEQPAGWHIACARFTNAPLIVRRDERSWWSCEGMGRLRVGDVGRQTGKYYLQLAFERLPADLQDQQSGGGATIER